MTQLWSIPAGTAAKRCPCGTDMFFIVTATGRKMPISCNAEGAQTPTATEPGRGISHFADCPNAVAFRRARRQPRTAE